MIIDVGHDSTAEGIVFKVINNSVNLVKHALPVFMLDAELIAVCLADRAVLISP